VLRSCLFAAVVIVYAILFGVLFGSHLGVLGDLVYGIDFTLKTKIINSLAVFGYVTLGIVAWFYTYGQKSISKLGGVVLFALWLSFSYGFLSPDCAIFNFCGQTEGNNTAGCIKTFDKQGSHAECE
jgi:hypothetical protein